MHTNPTTRILCYWDSLTRGRIPNEKTRYSNDERRTWVMQLWLWWSFEIIEEWVRWRYTNFENDQVRWRNWLPYFFPCILSHLPIDILILFLWTNNTQTQCGDTPEEILASFELYKADLEAACKEFQMSVPKVVLVSPPYIDSGLLDEDSKFDAVSELTSKILGEHYKKFAEENDRLFFDAASVVWYGVIDGIHLSKEQNKVLWEAMTIFIQWI